MTGPYRVLKCCGRCLSPGKQPLLEKRLGQFLIKLSLCQQRLDHRSSRTTEGPRKREHLPSNAFQRVLLFRKGDVRADSKGECIHHHRCLVWPPAINRRLRDSRLCRDSLYGQGTEAVAQHPFICCVQHAVSDVGRPESPRNYAAAFALARFARFWISDHESRLAL